MRNAFSIFVCFFSFLSRKTLYHKIFSLLKFNDFGGIWVTWLWKLTGFLIRVGISSYTVDNGLVAEKSARTHRITHRRLKRNSFIKGLKYSTVADLKICKIKILLMNKNRQKRSLSSQPNQSEYKGMNRSWKLTDICDNSA